MIDGFKKHYWYRFNKRAESVYINSDDKIDVSSHEEFMLDGEWHQCKKESNNYYEGYFYDSSRPAISCWFGDERKPAREELYMFDELSPAMYNIKKLKERQSELQGAI